MIFLVENLNAAVMLIKSIQKTERELHRGIVLKIYHINDLFSLFPYYDFGENYRENDQNDSLQAS